MSDHNGMPTAEGIVIGYQRGADSGYIRVKILRTQNPDRLYGKKIVITVQDD